jgi:hypothetical protein
MVLPKTIPNKIARVRALNPAPATAGMEPPHRATPVITALRANPGIKCHSVRCCFCKVIFVITLSFNRA